MTQTDKHDEMIQSVAGIVNLCIQQSPAARETVYMRQPSAVSTQLKAKSFQFFESHVEVLFSKDGYGLLGLLRIQ